ncbi:MAG TPA: hypothetical protein VNT42_05180 [Sphingomonas sp.]|nr:hypothetical protein [Sphingomonas sp.]
MAPGNDLSAWLSVAGAALGGGGIGAGVRPILDYWKSRRQQTDAVAMGLVEKLQARIERLEESSAAERALCDARLSALRHELRNVQGNFDALLLAIEIAPEKAAEVVARIKGRRATSPDAIMAA